MLRFGKIHARFKDGWKGSELVWYKAGYEEVKDDHPEVTTHFAIIKETIENPHIINNDSDYGNRLSYYIYYDESDSYSGQYMKVVIENGSIRTMWRSRVITAFFVKNIKAEEHNQWMNTKWKKT